MADSIYDYEVKDLDGNPVKLSAYKGKVLMIVNIASQCGQTPQLKGLEALYKKYKSKGFEILAFPSNDFLQQPEDGAGIQQFCDMNYRTTFKIFEKGRVRGVKAQPLYKYLAGQSKIGFLPNYPVWNFHKFIIGRNGSVVDYFIPWTQPDNAKITAVIEEQLAKKPVEK